jgi:hypothetical protein
MRVACLDGTCSMRELWAINDYQSEPTYFKSELNDVIGVIEDSEYSAVQTFIANCKTDETFSNNLLSHLGFRKIHTYHGNEGEDVNTYILKVDTETRLQRFVTKLEKLADPKTSIDFLRKVA